MKGPNQQHRDACKLIDVIAARIDAGNTDPIIGYPEAAHLIGRKPDVNGRYMGQVCSLCDAAALIAGWPMLMLQMVRKSDGAINDQAFGKELTPWRDQIIAAALSHRWTRAQVLDIKRVIADGTVPNSAATKVWHGIIDRGSAFITWNLHRKLAALQ